MASDVFKILAGAVLAVLGSGILWLVKVCSQLSFEEKKEKECKKDREKCAREQDTAGTNRFDEEHKRHIDNIMGLNSQKKYATTLITVCVVLAVGLGGYYAAVNWPQDAKKESFLTPTITSASANKLTPTQTLEPTLTDSLIPTDTPTPTNTHIPTPTPQKENSTVTPGVSDKNIEGNNAIDNKRIELSNNSFPSRVEDRMTEDALSTPFKGSSVEVIRDELIEELSNPVWVRAWFEYLSDIVDEETSKAMKKYIDDYDTSGLTPFYEAVLAEDGSTVFYLSEKYLEVIATYYDAIRGANIKIIYDVETKYTWNALSINLIFDETIPVIKKEMVIADQWNDFAQVTISIAGNEYTSYINLYDKSPAILN